MATPVAPAHGYEFGPFRLDAVRRRLLKDGATVPLRPKEFDLLLALAQRPGRDVSKDELIRLVWPGTIVEENNLPHAISKLRKALAERAGEHRYIVTVPGRGYRFVAAVRTVDDAGDWSAPPGDAGEAGLVTGATRLIVLPFRLLRPDPEIDFLSFSVPDAVTATLSGLDSLVVRSSATAPPFSGDPLDLQAIAARAQVDVVLTGTLLRAGSELRVTTQLVDVPSGTVLWSLTSQVRLGDIFQLQDELVRRMVDSLSLPLTARDSRRLGRDLRAREVDPEVYAAYLKGRYHMSRRTPGGLKRAIACFEAARARNPRHAPAHAGLADCYALGGAGALSRRETMARAKAAAVEALRLDAELPEAHASLASVAFRWAWDWDEAEREFRRAIRLDPRSAPARHGYGLLLAAMERFSDALDQMQRAVEADPLSLIASTGLGRVLDFARRHDEAIEQYRKTLEIDAGFADAHFDLGMACEHKGAHDEALAALERAVALAPGSLLYAEYLAYVRGVMGRRAEVDRFLREFDERSARGYASPFLRAHALVALDRTDEAFEWLERACNERAPEIVYAGMDPDLDAMRPDPRFQAILRRTGFPRPC